MSLLARHLASREILSPSDLEVALRRQQSAGGSLDTALLELGLLTPLQLDEALQGACGLPGAPVRLLERGPTRPWDHVPRDLLDIGWAIPLAIEDGQVWVAVHPDLPDAKLGQMFRQVRGLHPVVAPECCLAKVAAERTGAILAPRYALVVLDYLHALRGRESGDVVAAPALRGLLGHGASQPAPADRPRESAGPAPGREAAEATTPAAEASVRQDSSAAPARQDSSDTVRQDSSAAPDRQDSSDTVRQDSSDTVRQDSSDTVHQDRSDTVRQDSSAAAVRQDSSAGSAPPDSSSVTVSSGSSQAPADAPRATAAGSDSAQSSAADAPRATARPDSAQLPAADTPRIAAVRPDSSRVRGPDELARPPVRPDSHDGPHAMPVRPDSPAHDSSHAASVRPDSPTHDDGHGSPPTSPVRQDGHGSPPTSPVRQDSHGSPPTSPVRQDSRDSPRPSPVRQDSPVQDPLRGADELARPPVRTDSHDAPRTSPVRPESSRLPAASSEPRTTLSIPTRLVAPVTRVPGAPASTAGQTLSQRLHNARTTLASARERDRITEALVRAAALIAPRVGLFGVKREGLRVLAAPGSSLRLTEGLVIPLPEGGPLDRAVTGQSLLHLLSEPSLSFAVGQPLGIPCVFEPVLAGGRTVLMLYLDRAGVAFDPSERAAVRDLCDVARQSLEALLRLLGWVVPAPATAEPGAPARPHLSPSVTRPPEPAAAPEEPAPAAKEPAPNTLSPQTAGAETPRSPASTLVARAPADMMPPAPPPEQVPETLTDRPADEPPTADAGEPDDAPDTGRPDTQVEAREPAAQAEAREPSVQTEAREPSVQTEAREPDAAAIRARGLTRKAGRPVITLVNPIRRDEPTTPRPLESRKESDADDRANAPVEPVTVPRSGAEPAATTALHGGVEPITVPLSGPEPAATTAPRGGVEPITVPRSGPEPAATTAPRGGVEPITVPRSGPEPAATTSPRGGVEPVTVPRSSAEPAAPSPEGATDSFPPNSPLVARFAAFAAGDEDRNAPASERATPAERPASRPEHAARPPSQPHPSAEVSTENPAGLPVVDDDESAASSVVERTPSQRLQAAQAAASTAAPSDLPESTGPIEHAPAGMSSTPADEPVAATGTPAASESAVTQGEPAAHTAASASEPAVAHDEPADTAATSEPPVTQGEPATDTASEPAVAHDESADAAASASKSAVAQAEPAADAAPPANEPALAAAHAAPATEPASAAASEPVPAPVDASHTSSPAAAHATPSTPSAAVDAPPSSPPAQTPPVSTLHMPNLVAPPGTRPPARPKKAPEPASEFVLVIPKSLRKQTELTAAPHPMGRRTDREATDGPPTLSIPATLINPRSGRRRGKNEPRPEGPPPTLNMPRLVRDGSEDEAAEQPVPETLSPTTGPEEPADEDMSSAPAAEASPETAAAPATADVATATTTDEPPATEPVAAEPATSRPGPGDSVVAALPPDLRGGGGPTEPAAPAQSEEEVEAAIEAYLAEPSDATLARLKALDAGGLARLAARFPGPIDLANATNFPPPSAHGPLLRACVELGPPITPHILELFGSSRPQLRFYAAFLFQELRDPRCLRSLADLTLDSDPDVRLIATRVLETYNRSPEFAPAAARVRAELDSRDRERQLLATEGVSTLRDTLAVPRLIDLLAVRDKHVREAALEALCSITAKHHGYRAARWRSWYAEHGQEPRILWVMDGLRHRDAAVRRWAADELIRITGQRIPFPADGDRRARDLALRAWQDWWEREGAEFTARS